MFQFSDLSVEKHVLVVNALNAAIGHADVFPMLFETYDGREEPTAAEAAVTTEFCRYCLQNQHVPDGWETQFATIIDAIAYLWNSLLADDETGTADISRYYGVRITKADVESLASIARAFDK